MLHKALHVAGLAGLAAVGCVTAGVAVAASGSKLLPPTPKDSAGAKVSEAQALLLQALTPKSGSFDPGPAVNVAKVRKSGKSIWLITCGGGNLYCATVASGAQQAAKVANVPLKVYVASAPTDDATGIEEATAQGAGAIALVAVDPATVTAQLKAAHAKHIKIISLDNTNASSPPLPGTDANVTPSFTQAGQFNADYAVARNGADVHAYCMTSPEYVVTTIFCNGFTRQLKKLDPKGTVSRAAYPVATIPTNVATGLQAKLRSDPSINVVICGFDYLCQYAVPAIASLGDSGKVWAGTQTGQLSPNLKWVRQGHIQLVDAGIPSEWKGWATVDQAMRLMAGQAPAANGGGVPETLFTHESLAAEPASVLTSDATAYGTGYQKVYKRLWGVK